MGDLLNLGMFGKKPLKDQVTPYKMALLVLVNDYCMQLGERSQVLTDDENTYTEREEREMMFTILQLLQSADLDLKDLLQKLQPLAKPKLMDAMLTELKELCVDGIRSVMDLFQTVPNMLFMEPNPNLHKSSVLGLFVRRMVLSFEKLSFSQVTKLHQKYKVFYDTWASKQQLRVGGGAQGLGGVASHMPDNMMDSLEGCGFNDTAMSMMDFTGEDAGEDSPAIQNTSGFDSGRYSQRQAEFFISKQATLLQHNESEALPPKPLQQKINELLTGNPDIAEAHYLSYMNSLRVNEYCGALDSLCHYFDRHTGNANGGQGAKNKAEEEAGYHGLRYAALSMAALQFRFGHREEALAAVQEAISIAQETNDHVCLQHALSWLQRLGVEGKRNQAFLLDRLVSKSGELNLPYLTSLGVQAFTNHSALAGFLPSSVFEYILKSDIVNCQHSQSDLMSVSYGQKAALWNLYGNTFNPLLACYELTSGGCDSPVYAADNFGCLLKEQQLIITLSLGEMCNLSCQLMLHLNTLNLDVYHNSEPECLALCFLSRLHAQQGDYSSAFLILDHAKLLFPPHTKHARIWMLQEQCLIFNRALHHGKWSGAEQAVLNMAAIDSQEAQLCRAMLHKDKGETDKAFQLVEKLIKDQTGPEDQRPLPEYHARVLLLKAELFYSTGTPTEAGQPLLACLTIARQHHLTYMVAMATLHLAYVQMLLGMTHHAQSLLSGVLVTILRAGSLYDRARAYYLWARCLAASSQQAAPAQRSTALKKSVQLVGDVIGWFRKCEAYHRTKDAVYYQARLYHELGYAAERNKCALDFRNLDQQYPTWTQCAVLRL